MASKAEEAEPVICDFGFARMDGFPDLHRDASREMAQPIEPLVFNKCPRQALPPFLHPSHTPSSHTLLTLLAPAFKTQVVVRVLPQQTYAN